ncbi:hypothetical protein ABLV88_08005 [Staphylococcus equorum]|uniref:hypothetical protein n=1 Tax=Staphylococcus equorum TaxID=246432 RepID=UPI003A826C0E
MKKLLFLLLSSFLALAACGNEEEKSEDKKETKASDKESKKEDKEKDEEEKSEDKSNEEVVTQDENSQQTNTQEQHRTEEPVQSQEQVNTQEQQPVQSQEQAPVVEEQPVQQEPIDKEQWARENIEGGTDAHAAEEMEAFYQQERAKELEKGEKSDAINEKMEDPSLSKDEYNELVYEYNDLHDE